MEDLEELLEGYRQFHQQHDTDLYQRLSREQSPKALVISCCDSRVDPSIITQAPAGSFFMVRNVANLVPYNDPQRIPNSVGAAMEFAVRVLKLSHIVVIGHSQCAGINAMVEGGVETTDHIADWVSQAEPARRKAEARLAAGKAQHLCHAAEQSSLLISLENLMSYPWIAERVKAKDLCIHGWYFDIGSGTLQRYHKDKDEFIAI